MVLAKYVQFFAPGYAEHMMRGCPGGGESTWGSGERMQQFPIDPKIYILDLSCMNGS